MIFLGQIFNAGRLAYSECRRAKKSCSNGAVNVIWLLGHFESPLPLPLLSPPFPKSASSSHSLHFCLCIDSYKRSFSRATPFHSLHFSLDFNGPQYLNSKKRELSSARLTRKSTPLFSFTITTLSHWLGNLLLSSFSFSIFFFFQLQTLTNLQSAT